MSISVDTITVYNMHGLAFAVVFTTDGTTKKAMAFDFPLENGKPMTPEAADVNAWIAEAVASHGGGAARVAKAEKPEVKAEKAEVKAEKSETTGRGRGRGTKKSKAEAYDNGNPTHKELLGQMVTEWWGGEEWMEESEFVEDLKGLIEDAKKDPALAFNIVGDDGSVNKDGVFALLDKELAYWMEDKK